MEELQSLVEVKWTARAESYCETVNRELNSFKRRSWLDIIQSQVNSFDRPLEVLDLGTGPGFFAIILSQIGWKVKAVDCTSEMVRHAENNAAHYGVSPEFAVMDNHELAYPEASFDLLISRNVTWTLKEPERAYHEWARVLRPGGCLLIFDSNWYNYLYDEKARRDKEEAEREAQRLYGIEPFQEPDPELAQSIYSALPLGRYPRPDWDVEALPACGYDNISVDRNIADRVWDQAERVLYRSTPMFMIRAEKA